MSTPVEIYTKHRIPIIVQTHQLRVAAVGKIIAERTQGADVHTVVLTGLFHDMGNILKMDLSENALLAPIMASDSLETLRNVKEDYHRLYGTDEHAATTAIGKEIGLSEDILTMMDNMRFSRTEYVLTEAGVEMKIIKYADLRAAPYGIVPMRERLDEASRRYRGGKFDSGDDAHGPDLLRKTENQCFELERIVCEKAGLDPLQITESAAAPIIEELKAYSV